MLFVLVLTVATVVLADADYQYNAPSGLFNQPAPFPKGHGSQFYNRPLIDDHDKPLSHSVSYKNYIYLNKDVEHLTGTAKTEKPLSTQPNVGVVLNNDYAQTLAPSSSTNLQINSGYSYNPTVVSGNTNSGIAQTSTLSGVNLITSYAQTRTPQITVPTAGSGFSNNAFAQSSSSGTNLNNGYAPTFAPAQTFNFNSGYSNGLTQSHSISTGLSSGNVQTSTVTASSNLNNGYSYTRPESSGIGIVSISGPTASVSASSNLNAGFSQGLPQSSGIDFESGSGHTSPVVVSSNLNNGYSYSRPQSGGIGFASENAQPSSISASSNLNTGYSQSAGSSSSFVHPVSTNSHFSNDFLNEMASSGSNSFSNAYNTIASATSNLNSGAQSAVASSSASFNNGYIQSTGLAQPPTSFPSKLQSSIGTANSGFVQSLSGSSNNLNTVFTQQGSVNQAILKHIYFHVPPPEIEEHRFGRPAPPPKKNYKIIFVKVPSQESKSNLARLQLAQTPNGVGVVEHKTLIYILVKNPDTPQVITPKKIPSEHEVFFVKYNGDPLDIAAGVNEELENSGSLQSILPLEQGLVNGYKYKV